MQVIWAFFASFFPCCLYSELTCSFTFNWFFLYFWIRISYSVLYSLAMGWKEVNLWSLIFFQKHQNIEKCCMSWNRLLAKYIAFQHFKKEPNCTAKSRILCWRSWILKFQDLEFNGPKSGVSESHSLLLD